MAMFNQVVYPYYLLTGPVSALGIVTWETTVRLPATS
jgi:hypothetical protein